MSQFILKGDKEQFNSFTFTKLLVCCMEHSSSISIADELLVQFKHFCYKLVHDNDKKRLSKNELRKYIDYIISTDDIQLLID